MNKLSFLLVVLFTGFNCKAQDIRLNEVAASVKNSQVDNYGQFQDWIELFNNSKSDINLAGWYISDNPEKPLKWMIPSTNAKITTILAGSYVLLWADKDTLQGPDHLGFSLKKKGESLFLFRPDKGSPVLEDSVTYGPLPPDHSYGRCADGIKEWIEFKHPTPGKANICPTERRLNKKSRF